MFGWKNFVNLFSEQEPKINVKTEVPAKRSNEDLDRLISDAKVEKDPQKLHLYEEIILTSNNPKYCYYFAYYIKIADIKSLQEVVIKSGNVCYCYFFAKNIDGADVKKLSSVIMNDKCDNSYKEYVGDLGHRFHRTIK
jgi:hypothetical protein